MHKEIIKKIITLLEDELFIYHVDGKDRNVRIKLNNDEIQIVGKDEDDSDEVLEIIFIECDYCKDFKINIDKKGILLEKIYLVFD